MRSTPAQLHASLLETRAETSSLKEPKQPMPWTCLMQDLTTPNLGCEGSSAVEDHDGHWDGDESQTVTGRTLRIDSQQGVPVLCADLACLWG